MPRAKIVQIIGVDKKENYTRTYALLDDGTEASGYGEFKENDRVIYFHHEQWDMIKMIKEKKRIAH